MRNDTIETPTITITDLTDVQPGDIVTDPDLVAALRAALDDGAAA